MVASKEKQLALQYGITLFQEGRHIEAAASFNSILRLDPRNIDALYLLALSEIKLNHPQRAEQHLNSAIKLNKKVPKLYHAIGQAFEAQGKLNDALTAYKSASKLDPKNEWIYINTAIVYGNLNQLDKAIASSRAALRINHNNVSARTNLGRFLWHNGDNKAAKKTLEEALKIDPDYAQALSHMGAILFSEQNLDIAEKFLRQAHAQAPNQPEVLNNLTGVLLAKDEPDALEYCYKAVEVTPNYPNAYLYLGRGLELNEQWDEALSAYSKALEIQPDFKLASIGLANAKINLGLFDDAKTICWQEIEKDPNFLDAYSTLLPIEDTDKIRSKLPFIEQLYNKHKDKDKEKWAAAFSLAHYYEKDEQYEKSFTFLADANRLKRASFEYNLNTDKELFSKIKSIFDDKFLSKRANLGSPETTPIFIVGMPRSGTTLTEQILASHTHVYGAGELIYIKKALQTQCNRLANEQFPDISTKLEPDDYQQMANWYLSQVSERSSGAARVTDKLPHNFLFIGIIRILFPNAKIIHCSRNPIDNCLSIFKQNFKGKHEYANSLNELGNYYLLYSELMSHWNDILPSDIMLEIKYEDMVADQEGMTRKLLEFCELPWENNCLEFHKTKRAVLTASNKQVRRKMYSGSVKLWQHYEKQLNPLINLLKAGNTL